MVYISTISVDEEQNADEGKDDDEKLGENGLESRKRMHLEYQITSKNDADMKGGGETFITVGRSKRAVC